MMRSLRALALILGLVGPAAAGQYFNSPVTSTTTGSAWQSLSGTFYIAASSTSVSSITANVPAQSTWTITLNGQNGNITATQFNGSGAGLTNIPAGDITGGISTGAVTNATLSGNGNITSPLAVVSVPTSGVSLSTVTTQFNSVAVATTSIYASLNSTGSALSSLQTSVAAATTTIGNNYLPLAGGTMTGELTIANGAGLNAAALIYSTLGGNGFHTGISGSSITQSGGFNLALVAQTGFSVSVPGSGGLSVPASSATASAFFGDGSHLTGIPSTASIAGLYVPLAGGNMTGQLTTASTITVQGNAFSVGGSSFTVSGGNVGIGTASPATILDVNGNAQFGTTAKSTFTTGGNLNVPGTITAPNFALSNELLFYGAGQFLDYDGSSGTNGLNFRDANNSYASTLFLKSGGNVGIGTASPQDRLTVSGPYFAYSSGDGQFDVESSTNSAMRMFFGYDGANEVGFIQSTHAGVANEPLALNANGGGVGLGVNPRGGTQIYRCTAATGGGTTVVTNTICYGSCAAPCTASTATGVYLP